MRWRLKDRKKCALWIDPKATAITGSCCHQLKWIGPKVCWDSQFKPHNLVTSITQRPPPPPPPPTHKIEIDTFFSSKLDSIKEHEHTHTHTYCVYKTQLNHIMESIVVQCCLLRPPEFPVRAWAQFTGLSLLVLPTSAWVYFRVSAFLPPPKKHRSKWTGHDGVPSCFRDRIKQWLKVTE